MWEVLTIVGKVKFNAHIAFGLFLGIAVAYFGLYEPPGVVSHLLYPIGLALGAILPDIDHPNSWVGKRTWPISWLINKVFGHRGFFHSLLALFLLDFTLMILNFELPGFFMGIYLGYGSHLLADFLTPEGVPLFWPIKKRMRLPFIKRQQPQPISLARKIFNFFTKKEDLPEYCNLSKKPKLLSILRFAMKKW